MNGLLENLLDQMAIAKSTGFLFCRPLETQQQLDLCQTRNLVLIAITETLKNLPQLADAEVGKM